MSRGVIPALLATLIASIGAFAALREGGAIERRAPPPRPSSESVSAAPASARAARNRDGAEAEEVALRLVDALKDAKIEAPSLRQGLAALDSHWRKMQAPWTPLSGIASKLALSYALLTSDEEKEYTVALAGGGLWKPDARQWNMAEGSFDQRDAIFAPTPADLGFRVTLPLRAALDFSVSSDNAPADVVFAVRVKDAHGEIHEVWRRPVGRRDTKQWIDARVDLSAFGGQAVELHLVTSSGGGVGLALWGNPVVLAREKTRVPYNLLWIVVDATRADAIASFHDDAEDARKLAAPLAPLEALLPRIPGLTPELDALGKRGVRFTHAYSAASWTRPGTVAMLAGARSTELGLDTVHWQLPDADATRFYASDPPLLPLLLRREGVVTRAFVNNYFMVGYAAVGVDMGFEAIRDSRFRTRDTAEITTQTIDWLKAHKNERFFAFCNYNSPHEPLDPPARFLARVPPPPAGPKDPESAKYMAEVAKDDEAIGALLRTLDETGLRDRTIVVMTADHGETLSSAHTGVSGLDHMKVRYHHSASNFEETTHVPILLSLPGKLPDDLTVPERVRTIDIAPTILELEGLERPARMSGRSVLPLVRREAEAEPRVVLSEGRGTHGLLVGDYRLLTREGKAETVLFGDKEVSLPFELFDLRVDPGERKNVAKTNPERAAEMKARLDAAIHNAPVSGAAIAASKEERPAIVALRFAGGGAAHRVSGSVWVDDGATIVATPSGVPRDALRGGPTKVEVGFVSQPDAAIGLDVEVSPAGTGAALHWSVYVDDKPLAASDVYGGPFGLAAPSLASGLLGDEARAAAFAPSPPLIDPRRDFGLFVTRSRGVDAQAVGRGRAPRAGSEEMNRLMREWGYSHDKPDAAP